MSTIITDRTITLCLEFLSSFLHKIYNRFVDCSTPAVLQNTKTYYLCVWVSNLLLSYFLLPSQPLVITITHPTQLWNTVFKLQISQYALCIGVWSLS
jgi:hypothetical protein